jgi:hypothetical protein
VHILFGSNSYSHFPVSQPSFERLFLFAKMKSSVLLFLSQPLLSVAVTRAFWRMEMGAFDGAYRMDPIMSAGAVSRHAHVFHGSAGVGLTADYNSLQGACTTAAVLEDKSAYW